VNINSLYQKKKQTNKQTKTTTTNNKNKQQQQQKKRFRISPLQVWSQSVFNVHRANIYLVEEIPMLGVV